MTERKRTCMVDHDQRHHPICVGVFFLIRPFRALGSPIKSVDCVACPPKTEVFETLAQPVTQYVNILSTNATVKYVPNFDWKSLVNDPANAQYDLPVIPVDMFDVLVIRVHAFDETSKIDIFKNFPELYVQQIDLRTLTGLSNYYATPLFNNYARSYSLSRGMGEMGVLVGYDSGGRLLDFAAMLFQFKRVPQEIGRQR